MAQTEKKPIKEDHSLEYWIENIQHLSKSIANKMNNSLRQIDEINMRVRLLSFNAQIQAAKAGDAGRTFAVVANEIGSLSTNTARVAEGLAAETRHDIAQLAEISNSLNTDVRGYQLVELAQMNIDLIDRNLYERTCDVRWWATDSSVVDALKTPNPITAKFASDRLSVILNAYTIYFDIVLCDLNGNIIANGRPNRFKSVGMNMASSEWFRKAKSTNSGLEFAFETVHSSPLVHGKHILTYSCAVRQDGQSNGKIIGVLGVLFNWEGLAQTIVNRALLSQDEAKTRVCIVDMAGTVLADTNNAILQDRIPLSTIESLIIQQKGFKACDVNGIRTLYALATSPGYETYSTGWLSVIIQDLND